MRLFSILAVLFAAPALAQTSPRSDLQTVRVTGQASVPARPDLALLDFSVVTQAKTAAAAASENARRTDKLVSGLKKAVGPGSEVSTLAYTVTPNVRYPQSGDPQPVGVIEGYTVSNTVRVRTPDLTSVGKLIDGALQLGANQVQSLSFSLKNDRNARREALKLAAADARAEADALAAALGLRVVRVLVASDEQAPVQPLFHETSARMMMKADTPIEAGALEVQAAVHLTVEVAPAR